MVTVSVDNRAGFDRHPVPAVCGKRVVKAYESLTEKCSDKNRKKMMYAEPINLWGTTVYWFFALTICLQFTHGIIKQ